MWENGQNYKMHLKIHTFKFGPKHLISEIFLDQLREIYWKL